MEYRIKCNSIYEVVTESEDEWGWGEDSNSNHTFHVYKKGDVGFREANDFSFESDLPNPKVLVVIYGNGCTFGYTSGLVEYYGPFTEEEAFDLGVLIEEEKIVEFREKYIKLTCKSYASTPWSGYFANLEKVVII